MIIVTWQPLELVIATLYVMSLLLAVATLVLWRRPQTSDHPSAKSRPSQRDR